MKYGEHLRANIAPEYGADAYLNYSLLDEIIRRLSRIKPSSVDLGSRQVSLTMPPQTNAQGVIMPTLATTRDMAACDKEEVMTEETFLKQMDVEMAKVERFTLKQVTLLRKNIGELQATISKEEANLSNLVDVFKEEADTIAEAFLRLEKYVNLNFMGFHKILKKHDKWLPQAPCKAFYVNRMHAQAWVRGDYSDVVVYLSDVYAQLREAKPKNDGDEGASQDSDNIKKPNDESNQQFLRSTTKYWVKTEDVSRVKYAILRHLPVFLQKQSTGESDSQFTNSVYMDNDQLELYHGRLDKSPGAIALRLRWYGPGVNPKKVFVERKTHHDKWTGEVSVKERFMVDECEVHQVLTGTYPVDDKRTELLEAGVFKTEQDADEWEQLVREVMQVCVTKQLVPAVRTQCMRTAFQIPFDATVRISLDTNLCMISERGYDLNHMHTWHRDPELHGVLQTDELHRFPHAILEIKLQFNQSNATLTPPAWVTELQNSGMLYECHKYSKYVHGCAVLLPEDVMAVPYWMDDASLRDSIAASGAERILVPPGVGTGPGANSVYSHMLPFGSTVENRQNTAVGRTSVSLFAAAGISQKTSKSRSKNETSMGVGNYHGGVKFHEEHGKLDMDSEHNRLDDYFEDDDAMDCCESGCGMLPAYCSRYQDPVLAPTSIQKVEPKIFFANERTYLHWLHHGVILSTIASGILAFSHSKHGESWGEAYAMILLMISLGVCLYALHIFLWRNDHIHTRIPGRWDDPAGPMLLGTVVVLVLTMNFCTKIYEIAKYNQEKEL